MRLSRLGFVAAGLLMLDGCGGGGGSTVDAGRDVSGDAVTDRVAPMDLGRDSTLDVTPADGSGGEAGDAPRQDVSAPDLPGTPIDGVIDRGTDRGIDTSIDGGTVDPCIPPAVTVLSLVAGQASASGTWSGTSRLQPRTAGCTAGATGPELVYAVDVPAGQFVLAAATASPAGATTDTVVYVQAVCGAGPEVGCNDDATLPRGPSAVTTRIVGPARYFIVVDSFAAAPVAPANAFILTVSLTPAGTAGSACTPAQPGQTDGCASGLICSPSAGTTATCVPPSAPVIDAIELLAQPGPAATNATLFVSAQDVDGDWASLAFVFLDGAGVALDTGRIDLTDDWGLPVLSELPFPLTLPAGTRSVDATVTDSTGRSSVRTHAALTSWSTLGQTCDGALTAPDPCKGELVCAGTTCAVGAAATSACAQTTAVVLGAATTGTAVDLGADTFEGSCYLDRGGHDRVYRAVLPALGPGAVGWDLVVSSANAGVAWDYRSQLDTYVYVRTDCADPATELACNDDVSLTDLRSQVVAMNLASGTYYVYLDTSSASENDTGLGYALVVRARAVLKSGATCDPTGENDRCQGAGCLATGLCP